MKNFCLNHPEKETVIFCHNCNSYYCDDCLNEGKEYYYCNKNDCYSKYLLEGPSNIKRQKISKSKTIISSIIPVLILTFGIIIFLNISSIKRYLDPPRPRIMIHLGVAVNYIIYAAIQNDGGEGYIVLEATINCGGTLWTQSKKIFLGANRFDNIELYIDSTKVGSNFICNYTLETKPLNE